MNGSQFLLLPSLGGEFLADVGSVNTNLLGQAGVVLLMRQQLQPVLLRVLYDGLALKR